VADLILKGVVLLVEELEVIVQSANFVALGAVFLLEAECVVVEEFQLAVNLFVSHMSINNKSKHNIRKYVKGYF